MTFALVINSGSSSIKYQLLDMRSERPLATGLVERIGEENAVISHTVHAASLTGDARIAMEDATYRAELPLRDHVEGVAAVLDEFSAHGPSLAEFAPAVVGHRVVHGGARFFAPTIVTAATRADIADLEVLAPLHNPANLAGIVAAEAAFPDVPHVAVFDTAFHQTLAPAAYTYALDAQIAAAHRIRRYGFHGTSHQYVSRAAAEFLGRPLASLKQLVFHLGNGASVAAIDAGRSVETSMGFTPLEGLVMGTRSGDLDPAILFQLHRTEGMDVNDLDALLNKRSGLLGLAGASDMRDILAGIETGDEASALAFDVYTHRLKSYVGSYTAQLGGVDVITFTAGVGENAAQVRFAALAGLEFMGIEVDPVRNATRSRDARVISTDSSAVTVLVVPTNEELEIARQSIAAVNSP